VTGPELVTVGKVAGFYGVTGWVKVYSYTQPRDNILKYSPWQLRLEGQQWTMEVLEGRRHGQGIVASLAGCVDRDAARRLLGAEISVARSQLSPLAHEEYYWTDLVGLRVVNRDGVELGRVDHLLETGANDVLVVQGDRERLIPYLPADVVLEVDLEDGVLRVDWDVDF
jgi:16S rRNA processing protein RimM